MVNLRLKCSIFGVGMLLKSSFRNGNSLYVQKFCVALLSLFAYFVVLLGLFFGQNLLFLAWGMLSFGPKVGSFWDILGDGVNSKNYLGGFACILATFVS